MIYCGRVETDASNIIRKKTTTKNIITADFISSRNPQFGRTIETVNLSSEII